MGRAAPPSLPWAHTLSAGDRHPSATVPPGTVSSVSTPVSTVSEPAAEGGWGPGALEGAGAETRVQTWLRRRLLTAGEAVWGTKSARGRHRRRGCRQQQAQERAFAITSLNPASTFVCAPSFLGSFSVFPPTHGGLNPFCCPWEGFERSSGDNTGTGPGANRDV